MNHETAVEQANGLLHSRGYITVAATVRFCLPHIARDVDWVSSDLEIIKFPYDLVLVSATTYEDHVEQSRIMGFRECPQHQDEFHYYRAVAE
jgi:hypothetical protein